MPEREHSHGDRGSLILVGVDGSESSSAALQWAVREAARTGARVEAVYVYAPPDEAGWYDERHPVALPPSREAVIRSAERELDRAVRGAVGDPTDVPLSTTVVPHDSVPAALTGLAVHTDLLVLGGGRHSRLARMFGSTTTATVERSPCPAVVVSADPERGPAARHDAVTRFDPAGNG